MSLVIVLLSKLIYVVIINQQQWWQEPALSFKGEKSTSVIHSFPTEAHTEKLLCARGHAELEIYSPQVNYSLTNISSPLFHGIRKYHRALSPYISIITIFSQKLDAQFLFTYLISLHFLTDGSLKSLTPGGSCDEAVTTCACANLIIDLHTVVTLFELFALSIVQTMVFILSLKMWSVGPLSLPQHLHLSFPLFFPPQMCTIIKH